MDNPKGIPLQPVNSSSIEAQGYDEPSKTLAVRFKSGKGVIYHYHGVDQTTYNQFLSADSPGTFLRKQIIGKFATTKH